MPKGFIFGCDLRPGDRIWIGIGGTLAQPRTVEHCETRQLGYRYVSFSDGRKTLVAGDARYPIADEWDAVVQ